MQNKIIHHYRIIKLLGAGAFGQTYLAQNLKLPDQPVCVVKQLKPQSTDPESVKAAKMLFDREADTLHQIEGHEQIPQILDYFEEEQEFYLVQEYIEGETLREELDRQQPWDQSQAMLFLQEMLGIVAFIHSHKIIHRDIKPENIIRRNSDRTLFLIDFGAVKQFCCDRQQPSSTIIHSRGYSPPEQLAGIPELNSDIYALGMTCIEALTKATPESLIQLRDTRTQKISWSESLKICPEFKSILDKMVCISSKNRYLSADCVLRDLEHVDTSSPNNYTLTEITTSQNLHAAYTLTELRTESFADSSLDPEDFEQLSEASPISKTSAPPQKKKLNSKELSLELYEWLKDQQRAPQLKKAVDMTRQWLRKRFLIVSGSLIFTIVGLPLFLILSHTNKSAHPSDTTSDRTTNSQEPLAIFKEKISFKEHSSSIKFLSFAPDRKTLVSGSEAGLVKLRDLQNLSSTTITQTQSQILAMSSSANGNTLAIATEGKLIELWDLKTHQKISQIPTQQLVWSLAMSQYGDLAAGLVGKIKLWKIQPKLSETKQLLDERSQQIAAIALNPAADILARGSADGTVRISHLASNKSQSFHKHSNAINAVAIDANSALLFTGSEDDTIRIWNLYALSEHILPTIQAELGGVKAIATSPTAKIVAGGGAYGTVRIWNWQTGKAIASFSNHLTEVTALAFSPEGQMLAVGDRDGNIVIYTLLIF